MTDTMLTKNTDKLRSEVAAHIAADSIVQGTYWDEDNKSGCFIGCLAHSNDPEINEQTYGLPVMLQRIAESIFERLPAHEARTFFAALPAVVGRDGKDLTKVSWHFLAAELRALPKQSVDIQAVIDPVIKGMDLLASGQEWDTADADAAAARSAAWAAALAAARSAAMAAADAAAADAARAVAQFAAAAAARSAAAAADAAWAAAQFAAADAYAASLLRQRDLLLRLISEAPVVEVLTNG